MIEVNLLPPEYRRIERTPLPRFLVFMVGAAAIVASLFYLFYVGYLRINREKGRSEALREQIALQKPRLDIYDRLNAEIAAFEARKSALEEIWQSRILWSAKFDQLCDLVPSYVGLTCLEFTPARARRARVTIGGETAGTLVLDCISATANEKRLANFMRVLKGEAPPEPPAEKSVGKKFFEDFSVLVDSGWKKSEFKDYVEKEALEFRLELLLKPLKPKAPEPVTRPAGVITPPAARRR